VRKLGEIADYLSREYPPAVDRVMLDIEASVNRLAEHPYLGQNTLHREARRLVVGGRGYIVYYRVRERQGCVELLTVIHGRQQRPFEDA
jgi:plasmid stabilization system protein ParE